MSEQAWEQAFPATGDTKVPNICTHMMDDEYMLYVYKVRPCDRKGAHSWTECPFTHPGEKAARRCPKTHIYSAEACPDTRKSGKCARGDACPYSHGVFEQWLHPSRYRTQLCSFGTSCRRPVCFFAHTIAELRAPTSCGPAPAAAAAAQQAAAVAAAAAAACQNPLLPGSMDLIMQQALLAQMQLPSQVDGATATLINRYQAASCAALANAAACQRQQQQHQAAAAAAAAAAIAASASNPACLLSMAQAAQAYQAAAAAAAAAAANVPYTSGALQQFAQQQQMQMPAASTPFAAMCGSNSSASSPTCGSNTSSRSSGSAYMSDVGNFDNAACNPDLSSHYLLQQALFAAATSGNPGKAQGAGAIPTSSAASSPLLPWLPTHSAGAGDAAAALAAGAAAMMGYPSHLMPATPSLSDSSMASGATTAGSLDQLAPHLQRQLSISMLQN